jgi:Na+/proline symporter
MVSHIVIAVFSVWAGAWATILNYAHIDLGWLFYVQGVLLTPAVMPIAFTVLWKKQSAYAAFFGTTGGTLCGLAGWMRESSLGEFGKAGADHTPVGCQKIYGEINITNLALPYSAISGSAPGLVLSTIITVTWTLLRESKCPSTSEVSLIDQDPTITTGHRHGLSRSEATHQTAMVMWVCNPRLQLAKTS